MRKKLLRLKKKGKDVSTARQSEKVMEDISNKPHNKIKQRTINGSLDMTSAAMSGMLAEDLEKLKQEEADK